MHSIQRINSKFVGASGRESLYDLTVPSAWNHRIIIFLHGYMGYKDWGCWNLMEDFFIKAGYGFVKYNASHNGGTTENPIDFDDLDSFSINNYTKELEDFETISKLVRTEFPAADIFVLGHSRGGGIALLQSKNEAVSGIATLAAISSIEERFPKGSDLSDWRLNQYTYRKNGRTKQDMPSHISQYDDYISNKNRLNIRVHCEESTTPTLVIHGSHDQAVKLVEGERIADWLSSKLIILEEESHTFGSSQPWKEKKLPSGLQTASEHILRFFESEIF